MLGRNAPVTAQHFQQPGRKHPYRSFFALPFDAGKILLRPAHSAVEGIGIEKLRAAVEVLRPRGDIMDVTALGGGR